jgi:hypothetical protein
MKNPEKVLTFTQSIHQSFPQVSPWLLDHSKCNLLILFITFSSLPDLKHKWITHFCLPGKTEWVYRSVNFLYGVPLFYKIFLQISGHSIS